MGSVGMAAKADALTIKMAASDMSAVVIIFFVCILIFPS